MTPSQTAPIRVDILSDVVCPWCVIGFKELERAVLETGTMLEVYWRPFELNPHMPPEGQDLAEHIGLKYGSTKEQSLAARQRIAEHGGALGFTFNYREDARMVNTFQAHQLIHWAQPLGRGHPLKLALFEAYFTHGRDVSDVETLLDIAASVELDREEAARVLAEEREAAAVREEQDAWRDQGITAVPAMIFERKHLILGAKGVEGYRFILDKLQKDRMA